MCLIFSFFSAQAVKYAKNFETKAFRLTPVPIYNIEGEAQNLIIPL